MRFEITQSNGTIKTELIEKNRLISCMSDTKFEWKNEWEKINRYLISLKNHTWKINIKISTNDWGNKRNQLTPVLFSFTQTTHPHNC